MKELVELIPLQKLPQEERTPGVSQAEKDTGAYMVLNLVKSASWYAPAQEQLLNVIVIAWAQERWVPSGAVAVPSISTSWPCLQSLDLHLIATTGASKGRSAHNAKTE